MKVVGLVGGVACGKSTVANLFAELGAAVVDADRIAHQVLQRPEVIAAVAQTFGKACIRGDGQVDRKKVAGLVFANTPDGRLAKTELEQITHGPILAEMEQQFQAALTSGQYPVCVLDVPLLFSSGWNKRVDWMVYIDAPVADRLARARQRGWSEADFQSRELAQESLDFKRSQADEVIDNSKSTAETRRQVASIWRRLMAS